MWIKKKGETNKLRRAQSAETAIANMPSPIKEYESLLSKSCAGNDGDAVPNAAVIAADAKGWSPTIRYAV